MASDHRAKCLFGQHKGRTVSAAVRRRTMNRCGGLQNMRGEEQMRDFSGFMRSVSLIGQLGLSLATPVLLCLLCAYLMISRLGFGLWVYLPSLILGLGASFMTAYKVYLSATRDRDGKRDRAAFNKHY